MTAIRFSEPICFVHPRKPESDDGDGFHEAHLKLIERFLATWTWLRLTGSCEAVLTDRAAWEEASGWAFLFPIGIIETELGGRNGGERWMCSCCEDLGQLPRVVKNFILQFPDLAVWRPGRSGQVCEIFFKSRRGGPTAGA